MKILTNAYPADISIEVFIEDELLRDCTAIFEKVKYAATDASQRPMGEALSEDFRRELMADIDFKLVDGETDFEHITIGYEDTDAERGKFLTIDLKVEEVRSEEEYRIRLTGCRYHVED